jgi:hypothetical protein
MHINCPSQKIPVYYHKYFDHVVGTHEIVLSALLLGVRWLLSENCDG